MSRFGGPLILGLAVAAGFAGCSSGGTGKDECRAIEEARCDSAVYCKLGLESSEVELCKRFSRDNCIHGLPTDPPRESEVNRCVNAIHAAGLCARRQGSRTLASACVALEGAVASDDTTVCEVVTDPDLSSECAFLTEKPVEPKPEDAGAD
jgi:hypothetical protein